ncbi:MAG: site-specific DNA-methyltransferase [Candidatus Tectomicrobia bacterium]|nr:site-specific DNA-methyltransferase [Candidatus Tectomicrobia bacterium]
MTKEQKFYNTLKDLFVGAKVEGESGYINLMQMKSRYYEKGVFPKLQKDVEEALKSFSEFREELFDKLYTFFNRYFSESGSIYFRYTPLHQNVYEKVYTNDKDVMLFYKTHMLYYVKTDRLFRNLEVELDGFRFFFDVSTLEHKKANEKREIVYEFKAKRNDGALAFVVTYSEKGRKTKVDEILKELRKQGVKVSEEALEQVFLVFERQSEVDYFINKNAKAFLQEQFNLWLYQYIFSGESEWTETRIKQLQILKNIAFKIIDFISQFENELVKIWNKPKFVLNSNYVITLDRIAEKNMALVERLLKHENFKAQVEEWKQLGMVDDDFKMSDVVEINLLGRHVKDSYRYLPIDTRHFKDLELEILGLFDNLDEAVDGWLIKSENYQALNTILPKFREKVKVIYTDPPYNTKASEIIYANDYKHSSWLTLVENRLHKAKDFLKDDGILCITIDDSEFHRLYSLLLEAFDGEEAILGTISIRSNPSGRSTLKGFAIAHEYAVFVANGEGAFIGRLARSEKQIARYKESDEKGTFEWVNFRKHGGANANRAARPRLFYPVYVSSCGEIRIPKLKWDDSKQEWAPLEQSNHDDTVVYPLSAKGEEKTWKWGHETALKNITDLCARPDQTRSIGIYMKSRMRKEGTLPLTWWDKKEYSATDHGTNLLARVLGASNAFSFPKSVHATEDCLRVSNLGETDLCLDFFAGSGTTAHAVINLNREDGGRRKYILVEMADYFETVLLPRIKKVVFCEKWKDGKPAGGKGISHMVKYYELEQYEDTLRKARYEDADLFENPYQDPYSQYVFLRDLKMLEALEIDREQNNVKVNLSKLYENIDIAETLSNLTGKWIKRITPDCVEFEDSEKIDLKNLDWKLIKPLIWW